MLEWSLGEHMEMSANELRGQTVLDEKKNQSEPALGWLLSAASMKRMDEGIARYVNAFPFDMAACAPTLVGWSRGLIGDRENMNVRCSR
jgi:hypothetical protein